MLTKKTSLLELVFLTLFAVAATALQGCDRIRSRANALDLDEVAPPPPSPALDGSYAGGLYGSETGPLDVYAVDMLVLDDAARAKELQLRVTYPSGAGPFPVIVWSHGASGTKDMYQPLVRHWASHGYVCIQANHSDSRAFGRRVSNSPEMFGDWRSRPADAAFILDSLAALESKAPGLAGKMDHETIGVGGHSFGAHTAQLLAGAQLTGRKGRNESHADPRPCAFLLLSPQGKGRAGVGLTERSWDEMDRPFMVITGTKDYGRNGEDWEWRTEPFHHAPDGAKYLAVVDGGWHGFGGVAGGPQYHGAGPENPDHVRYVQSLSTAFWDRYLKEDAEAGAYLTPDRVEAATNYAVRFSTGEEGMPGADAAAPMPVASAQPVSGEPPSGRWTCEDAVWHDATRSRDVPVRVYAPESGTRLPAVVFSHGGGESREAFGFLGSHWAANGYIAVFLTHLGSDRAAVRDKGMRALAPVNDIAVRPTDLRFAIGKLVSGETGMALLDGRVDAERIAAAGQCAGSTTALAVAGLEMDALQGHDNPRIDGLVRCVLALSPQVPGGQTRSALGLHDRSWAAIRIPAMVVTGTEDFKWMPDVRSGPSLVNMAYDRMAPGGKYLVEIRGAEHNAFTDSEPYYPARPRDPRHHEWIQRATTAFLDAYLRGDNAAAQWLRDGVLEKETGGECRQDHKGAAAASAPMAPAARLGGARFAAVEDYLERSLDRMGGGGALLLIEAGEVVYRKAFGSFGLDTVVPIASATKWLSGGVIMCLVDEGVISLDDTAADFLPGFTGDKGRITIRQMFSHTHGWADQNPHQRDTTLTMAEAAARIASEPLAYPPGTALHYSGLGMQVAGRICEAAAGANWASIFERTIAGPLGMTHTDYYAFGRTENPNVAGSIRTNVEDYGKFLRMLLNGGMFEGRRVLSEEAVATMLTNQTGGVPIRRSACAGYADIDPAFAASRYGVGCWLEDIEPVTGKAARATSGGAFGCVPFIDLERETGGVYLVRARNTKRSSQGLPYNDAAAVFLEVRPLINAAFDGSAASAPEASPPPPRQNANMETPRKPAQGTGPSQASPRFERMWQMLDRNRDGLLSRDEVPDRLERLRRAFDWFDKNNDGCLSQEEVQRGMEAAQQMQPGQRPAPSRHAAPQAPEPVVKTAPERPVEASGTGVYRPAAPVDLTLRDTERGADVPLRITFPEDAGGRPLVVFSHYAGGTSADYAPLIRHWVARGFICAQPDHVGSHKRGEVPSGQRALSAWDDRPRDVWLVLDSMDTLDEAMRGHGTHIDRQRIGAGGHLIGAHTAGLVAGARMFTAGGGESASFHDPRVSAALLISPQGRGQGLTEASWREITVPMLVVAGSNNPSTRTGNPAEWRKEPYEFAEPPDKYLAWVEGFGGDCGGLGGDSAKPSRYPSTDPAIADDMLALTTAFWEAFLCGDAGARQVLTPEHWQTASPRLTLSAKTDEGQVPGVAKSHDVPSRQALEAAAAYSDRHGGATVLVVHEGGVIFEHYANGADARTALHVQSGTKGFWGPVVAAMIDDGLVTSFDEPAAVTLPEWRGRARKQDITLRNLLELNAGLAQDVVNLQGHERPALAPDLYAHAIDVPVVSVPGSQFSYGPVCYYALGEILKRKLADSGRTPLDYLEDRILDPLGVSAAKWVHDESGNPHIPNGAWLIARDWAAYGQFLLQEGRWNGRQLVSAERMRALREPSQANPGHGLALWLNTPGGAAHLGNQPHIESVPGAPGGFIYPGGEPDLFGALGGGKNRLYIVPSRSLVAVRQTRGHRDAFEDGEFLRILLEG